MRPGNASAQQGWLTISDERLPVFRLETERYVDMKAFYGFLKNKSAKGNLRFSLKCSKIARHLPENFLNGTDQQVTINEKQVVVFTAMELLDVCRAIIITYQHNQLATGWLNSV